MSRKGFKTNVKPSRVPQSVQLMTDFLVDDLVQHVGMKPEDAYDTARAVIHRLGKEFGGDQFYLARDMAFPLQERDMEIFRRFNGTNYDHLAREFGLSVMRVRQIVEFVRAAEVAKRQSELPGLESEQAASLRKWGSGRGTPSA